MDNTLVKASFKGYVLFETLLAFIILLACALPFISWLVQLNVILKEEQQKLFDLRKARDALVLEENYDRIKIIKNDVGEVIGVKLPKEEVRLIE